MAYFGRLGGAVRQSLARRLAPGSSSGVALVPPLHILSRGLASSRLFVGGLSWGTDEETVRDAFSAYGNLIEVKIINDRDTGRSRGFGFVTFSSDEEAESAMKAMDGQDLSGRILRVNYATSPGSGPRGGGAPRGFGYGGSRGAFGGDEGSFDRSSGVRGNEGAFGRSSGGFGSEQDGFSRSSGGFGSEQGGFGRISEGLGSEQSGYSRNSGGFSRDQGAFGRNSGGLSSEGGGSGSYSGVFGGDSGTSGRSSGSFGSGGTVSGNTFGSGTESTKSNEGGQFGRTREGFGTESRGPSRLSNEGGGFGRTIGGFGTEDSVTGGLGSNAGGFGRAVGNFGTEEGGVGRGSGGYGSSTLGGGFGSSSGQISSERQGRHEQKGLGLGEGGFGRSTGVLDSEEKSFESSFGSFDSNSSTDSWTGSNRISGGFSNKARRMRRAAGLTINNSSMDSSYGSLFNNSDSTVSSSKLGPDFWKDLELTKGPGSGAGTDPVTDTSSSSSGLTGPTANASAGSDDWRSLVDDSSSDSGGLRMTTKEAHLNTVDVSGSPAQSISSSSEDWRSSIDSATASVCGMKSLDSNSPSLSSGAINNDSSGGLGSSNKDKVSL